MNVYRVALVCLWFLCLPAVAAEPEIARAYNRTAQMNDARMITELSFAAGSSDLTGDARRQLGDFLHDAKALGTISGIKVASWADHEYPNGSRRTLDRSSRRLADERGQEIQNYIQDNSEGIKTELYNMAEKPDAMEKLFNTSDNVKLKYSLEKTGLAHPDKTRMPPKASRALVMIVYR